MINIFRMTIVFFDLSQALFHFFLLKKSKAEATFGY